MRALDFTLPSSAPRRLRREFLHLALSAGLLIPTAGGVQAATVDGPGTAFWMPGVAAPAPRIAPVPWEAGVATEVGRGLRAPSTRRALTIRVASQGPVSGTVTRAAQPPAVHATPVRATPVGPAASGELVDEALQAARLGPAVESMLSAIPAQLAVDPNLARLSAERRERVLAIYRQVFAAPRVIATVRERLAAEASAEDLEYFIAQQRSPLAQRALRMETASGSVPRQRIMEHAARVAGHADTRERVALLERMDDSIEVTETWSALTSAIIIGSWHAVAKARQASAMDEDGATGEPPRIDTLRSALRPKVREAVLQSWLYVYRNLEVNDLHAYVRMHEAPAMRSMLRLMARAMASSLVDMHTEALQELLRDLRGAGERQS